MKKQSIPQEIKYRVQFWDDENKCWSQSFRGKRDYQVLVWASKRASKLAAKSGKQYRVADLNGKLVYEAGYQLSLI